MSYLEEIKQFTKLGYSFESSLLMGINVKSRNELMDYIYIVVIK